MKLSDLKFERHEDGRPGHLKATVPLAKGVLAIITRGGDDIENPSQPYAVRFVFSTGMVSGIIPNLTFDGVVSCLVMVSCRALNGRS